MNAHPDSTHAPTADGASAAIYAKRAALPEIGARIGPYKLLQVIGEGGFGTVYMAEQTEPVHRRVALKVIKVGMDTKQVIARFEAERQALAIMDHPHIARVLDAGATDTGRPYFVMELVKGSPINQYADRERLTVPQRLELFQQVCHAVQHAHTKGIIHRDIKPSNVLVSTQDGKPHAKVIDFGIAKATDHRLTQKTLFTDFAAMIGTPEYMSPEQAGGSLDIDTRTDVYSLGVMLYELLCGATPFDSQRLRSAAYAEMQRIIREEEPPAPSKKMMHTPTLVARDQGSRKRALRDLDWVVARAMNKDRALRYRSAAEFRDDLDRWLGGDVVHAAPPSLLYRLRKTLDRNLGLLRAIAMGMCVHMLVCVALIVVILSLPTSSASRWTGFAILLACFGGPGLWALLLGGVVAVRSHSRVQRLAAIAAMILAVAFMGWSAEASRKVALRLQEHQQFRLLWNAGSEASNGRYESAATLYSEAWTTMVETLPHSGVSLMAAMIDMASLASVSPEAKSVFSARRDAISPPTHDPLAISPADFVSWAALNHVMGEDERTAAWFDRVADLQETPHLLSCIEVDHLVGLMMVKAHRWESVKTLVSAVAVKGGSARAEHLAWLQLAEQAGYGDPALTTQVKSRVSE